MAVVEVFPFVANVGAAGDTNYRVRATQFGDGYEQVAGDGINTEQQSFTHEFFLRKSEAVVMQAFIKRHGGYKAFEYTPPLGAPLLVRCERSSYVARTSEIFIFKLTLKQAHHA